MHAGLVSALKHRLLKEAWLYPSFTTARGAQCPVVPNAPVAHGGLATGDSDLGAQGVPLAKQNSRYNDTNLLQWLVSYLHL